MANTYIVDIGMNDTLQDVIRKVNSNLRIISKALSQQTSSDLRIERTKSDTAIDNAVGALRNELMEAMIPPVGTYIMCDYDPNKQWPGTTWTKTEDKIWKRDN